MQKGIGKLTFIVAFGSKTVLEPPAGRVLSQTQEVAHLWRTPLIGSIGFPSHRKAGAEIARQPRRRLCFLQSGSSFFGESESSV